MKYKIKELSVLAGVSVRTLQYYDEIGILKPKSVNEHGYRLYSDNELERLQQILFFKELGFSLIRIKEILDNPNYDKEHAMKLQKELLIEKRKRLDKIINLINKTIECNKGEIKMSKKEMFEGFSMKDVEACKEKYSKEAAEKYGNTKAYDECTKKTEKYKKDDWNKINEDANEIYRNIAKLMDRKADDKEVQLLVEKWRNHISKNFYDCTPEIFRGLAKMYVQDERFTENIDKFGEGLAKFLSEAMIVYCNRL